MLFFGGLAVFVMPGLISIAMPRLPEEQQPYVLLGAVLYLAIGLVPLCHMLGSSHLLGAFLAGFCFCTDDRVHAAWSKQAPSH